MVKKREKLEIIRDILLRIQEKKTIGPTKLLQLSNLSPQMFKEYMGLLSQKKFIEEIMLKKKKNFTLTEKGRNFLQEHRVIENLIKNLGL